MTTGDRATLAMDVGRESGVPDTWTARSRDKIGYESSFNRHFYRYTSPRPLEEIDTCLKKTEKDILRLLREMVR